MIPTVLTIKRHVAVSFGITMKKLEGRRRCTKIARPRQVAMFLASTMTHHSLPEIGRLFGGRDHTTVMHAVRRVGELMEKDPEFARQGIEVKTSMPIDLGFGAEDVAEDLEEAARKARQAAVRRAKTEPGCTVSGPPEDLRRALMELYDEQTASQGMSRDGGAVELLVSPKGTWTMIEVTDDGDKARMIASGRDWSHPTPRTPAPMPPVRSKPTVPQLPKQRDRTCLKCGKDFPSTGPGNRHCPPCRKSLDTVNTALAEGVSA